MFRVAVQSTRALLIDVEPQINTPRLPSRTSGPVGRHSKLCTGRLVTRGGFSPAVSLPADDLRVYRAQR